MKALVVYSSRTGNTRKIAEAIAAAEAGAAIVHIHVRDPQTRRGSREVALYAEVVERLQAADCPALLVFCTSRRLSMRLPEGARRRNRPLAVQL